MAEFRLLGPIELLADDTSLDLGPPKQRAVLAALVADAGRPVPVSTLVDRVWDENPPAEARNALYAHIMRIRRVLAQADAADGSRPRLERCAGGYRLDVDRDRVDLHRFRHLTDRARDPGLGDDTRAALLRDALALWRGTPLDGLSGSWPTRIRESCRQQRIDAVVAWGRTELALGNHEAVIGQIRAAIEEHPLVEPLTAVLMQALDAAGRTAEALDCYISIGRRLAAELGVDPTAELRDLHQAILRSVPPPAPAVAVVPANACGPCTLPRDLPDFTGRAADLAQLQSMVDAAPDAITTIVAVDGMPGVGKTASAIRFAHRMAPRYPDGQLFVDLLGHSDAAPARSPAGALDMLLTQLGAAPTRIPDRVEGRIALWRAETSDRRLLVLLDNASNASQVEPLLPNGPECLVLVTSRTRLTGLDGTHALSLDTLRTDEARLMFARAVGDDRAAAEPEAVDELVRLCGHLPLAIRLAGARLAHRPQWTVGDLVCRLSVDSSRLATLSLPGRGVEAAFELSYHQLNADQQHVFTLLGLHPGDDVTVDVLAAASGRPLDEVEATLQHLVDVHLVGEHRPGRYRQHDLLRRYARQLATADPGWRPAVERMLEHYLATAAVAARRIGDARPTAAVGFEPTPQPWLAIDTAAEARGWLTEERANLLAAIRHAVASGWPLIGQRLAFVTWRFLIGHSSGDCLAALEAGIAAARDTGDARMDAVLSLHLGITRRQAGDRSEAIKVLEAVVELCQRARDAEIEACATGFLAINQLEQGNLLVAVVGAQHIHELLAEHPDAPTWTLAPVIRVLAGWVYGAAAGVAGEHDLAVEHLRQALAEADRFGDTYLLAEALAVLGHGLESADRLDEAQECYRKALAVYREAANRHGEATALTAVGRIKRRRAETTEALRTHVAALDVLRDVGDPHAESVLHNELGLTLQAAGRTAEAIQHQRLALDLAQASGQVMAEARAHASLGLLDHPAAEEHRRAADSIFDQFGVPPDHSARTPR